MRLYVCLIFFVPILSFSQPGESILWYGLNDLQWTDFAGIPDTNSPYQALTSWGISYSFSQNKKGETTIKAYSYFEKMNSWVKKGHNTTNLLHHEQQHFNIAEWYTRKFRFALSKLTFEERKDRINIKSIYDDIIDNCIKTHKLYDHESNHGRNSVEQKKWTKRISSELKKLNKYAN